VAVGGEGELTTRLMQVTGGRVTAKGGAEGLQCLTVPERRLGVVVKAEDGAMRGLGPAVLAVLEELKVWLPDDAGAVETLRRPLIRNYAGDEVGYLEATVRHLAPTLH
jgi:L-asparaginase II